MTATRMTVHPFPARMAPELALEALRNLRPGSRILDPMVGSGTVVRAAIEAGHDALGIDVDPLAVLIAKVATRHVQPAEVRAAAELLAARASELGRVFPRLAWIDDDPATSAYVDYWFGPQQQSTLRRLVSGLDGVPEAVADVLRLAISRTIITKDHGASLARDVSHSRPHRAFSANAFDVIAGFRQAVERIIPALAQSRIAGQARVFMGDARCMAQVESSSIDAIVTSPPYLNAIDYIRGHRLALVWLGYRVAELRAIRSGSVGAERAADAGDDVSLVHPFRASIPDFSTLPPRIQRMLDRYMLDLYRMLHEFRRVLVSGGSLVAVIGNSTLRGTYIPNAALLQSIAKRLDFAMERETVRDLPHAHRYLPPPRNVSQSRLDRRISQEVVTRLRAP